MARICNDALLLEYVPTNENPWDVSKVLLVFRRLGFGIKHTEIESKLSLTPSELIDELIDNAKSLPVTPDPGWANWTNSDFRSAGGNRGPFFRDHQKIVFDDFLKNDMRDRLTLFWSNHFVTEYFMYNHPAYTFRYYNNIQSNVFGNFKDFVSVMGLDDAMLMYLNGFENRNNAPNENYARELYELFTLGEGNGYTQDDITETARALTGYNNRQDGGPIYFNQNRFDNGEKTIFGKTGNWNYDDVINILFDEKSDIISKFIVRKIYKHFVSPEINEQTIDELALYFKENNFELDLLYRKLFKSEHFFNSFSSNVLIKSPIDLMVFIEKEFGFQKPDNFNDNLFNYLRNRCSEMGQEILNPVDVAGWQENHDWISTGTLPMRWEFCDYLLSRYWNKNREQFRTYAISVVGIDETNPVEIVKKINNYMFCNYEMMDDELNDAVSIFKGDLPDNYFNGGGWTLNHVNAPRQAYDLIKFFVKIPEYQLK
tara:strand:+ start:1149 stop:2603 length:1455 start_codon:yes stop_codon:yes gene_type:complete